MGNEVSGILKATPEAHRFVNLPEAASVQTLALPPRSPNPNAYAERWVRVG
jgi:hypothetical protein